MNGSEISSVALIVVAVAGCALSTEGEPTGASSSTGATAAGGHGASSGAGAAGGSGAATGGCPAGQVCVAASPADAVVRLSATAEPACPPGFETPVVVGDGAQPGCGGCSACSAPQGTCTVGDIVVSASGSCGGNNHTINDPQVATCIDAMTGATTSNADAISGASGIVMDPPAASAATCAPGTSQPADVASRTICTATAATHEACDGGICVPAGTPSFDVVCVAAKGGACPAGLATKIALLVLEGDTRTCGCACQPAAATCPGAQLVLHGGSACNDSSKVVPADGTCTNISNINSVQSYEVSAGTFTPGAGCTAVLQAAGSVSWGAPVDLCCSN